VTRLVEFLERSQRSIAATCLSAKGAWRSLPGSVANWQRMPRRRRRRRHPVTYWEQP
jgi:hypothetical protein